MEGEQLMKNNESLILYVLKKILLSKNVDLVVIIKYNLLNIIDSHTKLHFTPRVPTVTNFIEKQIIE
jgi:hypothetical protein